MDPYGTATIRPDRLWTVQPSSYDDANSQEADHRYGLYTVSNAIGNNVLLDQNGLVYNYFGVDLYLYHHLVTTANVVQYWTE